MGRLMRALTAALITTPLVAVPATMSVIASVPAAQAEVNPPPGTDLKPVLGWSSWSFYRNTTDAAALEAQARALRNSPLYKLGYRYINLDDFWYQCPGSQGPNVDQYGRWVTDPAKYPPGPNGENGIKVVADYVHSLGLKFGIYATPGISDQAVTENTSILGTSYHASDIANTTTQNNYFCGRSGSGFRGMTGIDYSKPGAQAYVNSIVDEFASWGADYIKLDGIREQNGNIADIKAWSDAIRQSGRPMGFNASEGYTTDLGPAMEQYATQWQQGNDIENYGGTGLTDYANVEQRFGTLATWEPTYGGKQWDGYNDFDSVELGNCTNAAGSTTPFGSVSYPDGDGLSLAERQTVLSLWSLGSSPLILGTDLTHLCSQDLQLLANRDVLSVDQDGLDSKSIVNGNTEQVIAKTERPGQVVVGLFNTSTSPETITVNASDLGLPSTQSSYQVKDLWTHRTSHSGATISADVAPHGVALLRVMAAG
jgi:alpha galactosidase C-like protein/alpha galactosidase A-like protein